MESTPVSIDIDLAIYRLNAVKKSAYRFGDRCHISISDIAPNRVQVQLKAKRILDNIDFLVGEFRNELLDQELREVVAAETRPIRDLLLAQAFSATSLLNPAADQAELHEDPLQIRDPDQPPEQQPSRVPS
jgi:His-Xaa-Ser system protein HxsD